MSIYSKITLAFYLTIIIFWTTSYSFPKNNFAFAPTCTEVPCAERDALIALYNATDGPNWDNNTNWNTSEPVSTWYGVTVHDGHVTQINITYNNLVGSLPSELGDLTNLSRLNLSNNELNGVIPSTLGSLSNLLSLSLNGNQLTGSIPSSLGNLTQLNYLILYENQLTGAIPSSLGNLSNLTSLALYNNQLSGNIPTTLGNLNSLTMLDLSENELAGSIPSSLGNMTNLSELQLSENQLSGSMPPELGNLSNLEELGLYGNQLTGTIPASLGNLNNLRIFRVPGNQLSGTIPVELSNMSSVTYFDLAGNQFTGSIPPELGDLDNLEYLRLHSNQLTGSIPSSIGNLPNLSDILLNNNQLSGSIPSSFTNLTNLEYLRLHDNNLSGPIPDLTSLPEFGIAFYFNDNAFQFGDFENEFSSYDSQFWIFWYSPQAKVDSEITINKEVGESVTFTVNVSGSANKYQWYHDYTPIDGATSSSLTINDLQLDDAGRYHAEVTSTIVTGLTIQRQPIHLNVSPPPDTEDPSITCPGNQELACDEDLPDYTHLATVTDNQDPNPTVTQSPSVGSTFTNGMTITLTATDASGNESSCTFTVNEAADNEDPAITCPGDQELAFDASLPDYTDLATASDNCDDSPAITQSPAAGSDFTDGMSVTLTATDDSGNANSCSFIVNKAPDTEAPDISCPGIQALACDATVPDYTSLATVSDNEDPNPTVTQDPAVGSAFTDHMTITLTATDASGNESSCTFTVNEAADTEGPAITCPGDQELAFDASLPDYTDLATASDNCDDSPAITQSPAAGSDFTDGMSVTLTATDDNGNANTCTFIVNASADTEPPTITCPNNQSLACNETLPDYTDLATVTDNEDPTPTVTQDPAVGSAFTAGMAITLTATDASGNESSCTFTVNEAADTEDPAITCPGNRELAPGATLPDYTTLATASDNCDDSPAVTQSPAAGSDFTDGMTVTLTATDESDNTSSCSFFINQTPDNEAPSITCPDNQQLACDAVLPDYTNQVTATDNQDPNPTITQDPVAGSVVSNGMSITLTATDASGNESSCSFTINVEEDAEAPSLTCPGDQTVDCGTSALPDFNDLATATDNCDGDPTITQSPAAGAEFTEGMTVTIEATDQAGNTSSCSFIVNEATDNTPPTVACLADQIITCGDQLPDYTNQVEVSDKCDPDPTIIQSPAPGTTIVEDAKVIFTVTDNSGNETSCSFTVQTETGFTVDAGVDKEIIAGDSIQLEATSTESGVFVWSSSKNILSQNMINPITVAPDKSTPYTVTLKRADGCSATDEVLVTVVPDEGFKEKYGISPDGDGINETWRISGIEDYPDNMVSIFNKWGQLVYETKGYDNDLNAFDGQANRLTEWGAGELPEGTYYFLIQFPNGQHEKVNGFIMIKR